MHNRKRKGKHFCLKVPIGTNKDPSKRVPVGTIHMSHAFHNWTQQKASIRIFTPLLLLPHAEPSRGDGDGLTLAGSWLTEVRKGRPWLGQLQPAAIGGLGARTTATADGRRQRLVGLDSG
jgi:hypothetical protein